MINRTISINISAKVKDDLELFEKALIGEEIQVLFVINDNAARGKIKFTNIEMLGNINGDEDKDQLV